jgi:hypothetical protein
VTKLRSTLSENSSAQRQAEKEKSSLIQTLTEQNQRLTQQLKEVRLEVRIPPGYMESMRILAMMLRILTYIICIDCKK